jgi:hypothetical protein
MRENCIIDGFEKSVQILDLGFTEISKSSGIKKARLRLAFSKLTLSDFEIPVKSSVSYLNYYINTNFRICIFISFMHVMCMF